MSRLRVLFIADRYDGPYRYRCLHACEQLRRDGIRANVLRSDDPAVLGAIGAYSVVVLFRLPWSAEVEAIVERARRADIKLVFDVDDLVFDPKCGDSMPFRARYSGAAWEQAYGRQLRALRRTFDACDLAIVSTDALAEHAEHLGKPARVHPNLVSPLYLRMARRTARARRLLRKAPTLGYFSGSDTHDADFASITAPLLKLLVAHPDARLLICGHLDRSPVLRSVETRVVRLPYMSWRVYPWALASCHVTLAPLAMINAFADSKSALKFFEAGALGVPTVASPAREFTRSIEHGVTGWLAASETEWFDALTSALEGASSERVGAAARQAVQERHSFDAQRGKLREILESIATVTSPTGRQPAERAFAWDEYDGRPGKVAEARAQGRRALELAALVRLLAAPREAVPDLDAVDRWLEQLLTNENPAARNGAAWVLTGEPERHGWRTNDQLVRTGALPGEHRASGSDPHWLSPSLTVPKVARYLVVRLRALADGSNVNTQLFWGVSRRTMQEESSVRIPITADGVDRTYLVDLWSGNPGRFWKKQRPSLRLRLDPLDRAGVVGLSAVALLPEDWMPPPSELAPPPVTELVLPAKRKNAEFVLSRAFAALELGDRLKVLTEGDSSWLRRVLQDAAGTAAIRVESLREMQGGACAIVVGAPRPAGSAIDVVVPVHNARKQTLRCLRSVLRHGEGDFRLVVIDDASTDPQLWPALLKLGRREPRIVLKRNKTNLGFSATVNHGIRHAAGRDVLVLNSDTKVFSGFLRRLRDAAHADPRTGIVCPLSNNATICSAPEFCRDNPLPPGLTGKQMARLVRSTATKERPELVTPVGFCMYLRSDLIEDVGDFDAKRYGRGFGEENDLGERAKARGWRIRLADDVYVLHEGKASFGELGHSLEAQNQKVLEAQHPGYHARVAQFIRENPLASVHAHLKWHLRRRSHRAEPAPLELLHNSPFGADPGGTEHVVRDLIRALRLPRVVLAYPSAEGIEVAEVIDGDVAAPLRYSFALSSPAPRFAHEHAEAERVFERLLELFRVGMVHVHHLFHWPLSVGRVLRRRRIPYVLTQHDFYAICPSANLLDMKSLELCCPRKSSDGARVTACLGALCSQLGVPELEDPPRFLHEHRRAFAELLDGAERVLFPSSSAQRLTTSVFAINPVRLRVLPHGYDPPSPAPAASATEPRSGPLRVALLGEIAYPSKGANEYLDIIRACSKEDFEWHIFGNAERFGFEQRLAKIGARTVFHGSYRRSEVIGLLTRSAIDVGLLMPIWPETFSLTLSELLSAKVPVIAARQGALTDKLEARPYGILVTDAAAAVRALKSLSDRGPLLSQLQEAARDFEHPSIAPWAAAHAEIYARALKKTGKSGYRRLSGSELRALGALRVQGPPAAASIATTRPASRYTSSWWYPLAERVKPHVPESVRAFARRWLAADGRRITHRLRLPGPHARLGSQLKIVRRYLGTTLLESLGNDPHLLLKLPSTRPDSVQAVSFNLWCSQPNPVFAQLYWQHRGDTRFSEEKSIAIPLEGRSGAWQEYVIWLDELEQRQMWADGDEIVSLRFDPMNQPGLVGLGELTLCTVPKQLLPGPAPG